jgi:hypothetical protein
MILFWDRSIITDKMVVSNRPDTVLIDRIKQHLQQMYTAVPLTQNLPKTEAEKIMNYENLAVEIWKLNNESIYPLVICGRSGHQKLPKISGVGQKAVLLHVSYNTQIPRTCHFTLRERMNFIPLTEPNPTDNLG